MWKPTGPYPGWVVEGGRLTEDRTVTGCRQRGMVAIKGECRQAPCRRHLNIELEALERQGYGKTPVREIMRQWECVRLKNCSLMWHDHTYPAGVPLGCYLDDQCRIRVTCQSCKVAKLFTVPEMIDALEQRGAGGPNTSSLEIAKAIPTHCRACQKRSWEVKLEWGK